MAFHSPSRLSTKIAAPVIRSLLVKRSLLVERLRVGMARKLTLVVAPAGYGKTTLMGEWLAPLSKEGWPVSWLTLENEDNDPLRFWSYLLDALHAINPEWLFEHPKPSEVPNGGIDRQAIVSWINLIDATPKPFSLILDDYHAIQLESIHKDLFYLIAHMPQHMHVIVASRVRPKFPLAELRVKNQLVELDRVDLAFNLNESTTFLQDVMELDLPPEEIAVLTRTTEGWVSGLHMAALSIKNQPNASQWIDRFSGKQGYIYEYLTEAVLDIQDDSLQEFLLKTSILSELSAPLCDFLLEIRDSRARLNYLETTNLFIVPMGEERIWYRYHALFADTLRTRLEMKYPQTTSRLHLRAAVWLNDNGFPEKAIPHAVSAGDLELACKIIEENALLVINRLDFATLSRWLNYLPEPYLWKHPIFWIYRGLIDTSLGNLGQAAELLQGLKSTIDDIDGEILSDEDRAILGTHISAIQAAVDLQSESSAKGISLAMQALGNLPEGDNYIYGWLNHYLGYAYESAGELEGAIASFVRGYEFALAHHMPEGYIFSKAEIGRIRRNQGRLREAERELRQALDYVKQTGMQGEYVHFIHLALVEVFIEQNQFKIAANWVSEAVAYLKQVDIHQYGWLFTIKMYTYLAKYFLQVDLVEARKYLQKARGVVHDRNPFTFILSIFTDLQVRIWLGAKETGTALGWVEKKTGLQKKGKTLTVAEQIALARIFLSQGRFDLAIPILLLVEEKARESGRGESVLQALILQALAYQAQGQAEKSLDKITQALALAEPEGFIRLFVDEGMELKTLLSRALSQVARSSQVAGIYPSKQYIEKLITAFDSPTKLSSPQKALRAQGAAVFSPLIEPLSDRELEVLFYLREGRSSVEIAELLTVSRHTVKTHIRNIYQKLDVHDRKEAIDRAVQLSLFN